MKNSKTTVRQTVLYNRVSFTVMNKNSTKSATGLIVLALLPAPLVVSTSVIAKVVATTLNASGSGQKSILSTPQASQSCPLATCNAARSGPSTVVLKTLLTQHPKLDYIVDCTLTEIRALPTLKSQKAVEDHFSSIVE